MVQPEPRHVSFSGTGDEGVKDEKSRSPGLGQKTSQIGCDTSNNWSRASVGKKTKVGGMRAQTVYLRVGSLVSYQLEHGALAKKLGESGEVSSSQ